MVKAPYAKLYSIIKTQTMSADSEQCDEVGISSILGHVLRENAVHRCGPLILLPMHLNFNDSAAQPTRCVLFLPRPGRT